MTRKDYIAFANILRGRLTEAQARGERSGRAEAVTAMLKTINDVAELFQAENPRFDRARFLAACGA